MHTCKCMLHTKTIYDISFFCSRLELLQHNVANTSWSLFWILRGRNMMTSTTNLTLSIGMRGRRTSLVPTATQNPVLPQVTDYRLPNYTACNHRLSDFLPQTLTSWWPAFNLWATAIKTALKCKLYSITIFGLQITQKISALIKGCYWKLLDLIKQKRAPVMPGVFTHILLKHSIPCLWRKLKGKE